MKVFLPMLSATSNDRVGPCGMTRAAAEFVYWWMLFLGERAADMRCDARLVRAAQAQADWLAVNDFVEGQPHVGEGGMNANERVRAFGYALPEWQGDGNTVESATRSWDGMPELVSDLMAHEAHHDHMWITGWFEEHRFYGVGSALDQYFVVVAAPKEER